MNKIIVAGLIGLGVVACAQRHWVKDGSTAQDYSMDSYNCEKDARQSGYFGSGLIGSLNMQEFFDKCMVAHGWHT